VGWLLKLIGGFAISDLNILVAKLAGWVEPMSPRPSYAAFAVLGKAIYSELREFNPLYALLILRNEASWRSLILALRPSRVPGADLVAGGLNFLRLFTNSLALSDSGSFFSVLAYLLLKKVAGIWGGPSGPVNSK
jgi:hypothetical protein